MPHLPKLNYRAAQFVRSLRELTEREKRYLRAEIQQVSGLMPLLMKRRNRMRWSREDKQLLMLHLQRLSRMSPYLVVLAMPGGLLMLPALAWWLDRRRNRNRARPAATA